VVIYNNVKIGDNVEIHAGTVIGGPAFYYKGRPEGYEKWHSCGQVIIEDNVEIGPNCTIDKGVSGNTVIGEGTKLDNLVHIAHGVEIGKQCLIASQVGIAGKTIIEDNVIIYGQAGVSKSLRIGAKAIISAKAGVSKSLEGGKLYFGTPATEARTKWRELAALRQLPDILRKLKK
jgi:UDP-3-O-[3-hydroxymyristoyl] glucosamine N-acyltransferase